MLNYCLRILVQVRNINTERKTYRLFLAQTAYKRQLYQTKYNDINRR
jgi:hypothetical protein